MEIGHVSGPPLFPCADRVKVPQIGADHASLSSNHYPQVSVGLSLETFLRNEERYNASYLKKISGDLLFSEDVIRTHASHSLPYDRYDTKEVFRFKKTTPKKKKKLLTDSNKKSHARGFEKKHVPCHIHKLSEHKLTPLKVPKFKLDRDNEEELVLAGTESSEVKEKDSSVFLTQNVVEDHQSDQSIALSEKEADIAPVSSQTWDSQLLMKLSKNTARWIVGEKTCDGPQKARLDRLLEDVHGVPSGPIDTLIRDDASVSDLGTGERDTLTPPTCFNGSLKKGQSSVKEIDQEVGKLETKESEPLVSFYRLPFGLRKAQRDAEREAAGAINATARDIKIYRRKAKPPPTLRDIMNPEVGDKMFDTENQFEQEWLSGVGQLYKPDRSQILMSSGNLYQTYRQLSYPINPDHWHEYEKDKQKKKKKKKKTGKREKPDVKKLEIVQKGYSKWSKLPEAIQEEVMSVHEAGYDPEAHREPSPSTLRKHRENPALVRLVDEWRSKWNLSNKWYDSSIEDLERDLKDLNEHVRLQAVATIARASTFRPAPEPGISVKSTISRFKGQRGDKIGVDSQGVLPETLVRSVERAVNDPSHRVRITAAITLYTLSRPNEEARTLLNDIVRTGTPPERWAAAQCLAHAGVCDSYIVGELVNQLFSSEDIVKHEQCVMHLSKLSQNSSIVHSMVAEQLNSTSWRRRIVACKVLPRLHGIVNKDITHKLTNLMWNDWHKEVRMIAAQTLGKTGHGKVVHNDLRDRLLEGNERDKIDSLYKIGHLGIMTARLLPAYLRCFDDAYISVRIAAASTAAKLELKDDKVLNKLLFLTQYDNNWKVKAHAVKALGVIGEVNNRITDAVIWALRFEAEPGVRAEACDTLVRLGIKGDEISTILQDKLLVELDPVVRKQLAVALEAQGVSSSGDMEMVQQIKDEVRRLCTRFNIAAKIAKNEEWEAKQENHREMFNNSPRLSEFEGKYRTPTPPQVQTRPSTRHSQRTKTPTVHITSEDSDDASISDSFDSFLPQSPTGEDESKLGNLEVRSRRSSVISLDTIEEPVEETTDPGITITGVREGSPGNPRSNNSRLTPAEKLEKLIEVYEGTCSYDEYEKYVRPEEDAEDAEDAGTATDDKEDEKVTEEESVEEKDDNENELACGDTLTGDNKDECSKKEEFGTATEEQAHIIPNENDKDC